MHASTGLAKFFFLPILMISSLVIVKNSAIAANLSNDDAKRLLEDTMTISWYMDLNGESDYTEKPLNIIKAALFGAYDAKGTFEYEQEQLAEAGKQAKPANSPLFTIDGRTVTADQIMARDEAPDLFKGLPETFTYFITRDAAELSALRYTGHRIKEHMDPKDEEYLGGTRLTDKGYFVGIDGLGCPATEAELKNVAPNGEGFVLTGKVVEVMGEPEEQNKPWSFRLELTPGDAPGTWKRQLTEPGKPKQYTE